MTTKGRNWRISPEKLAIIKAARQKRIDAIVSGELKLNCKHGHSLNDPNNFRLKPGSQEIQCRVCMNARGKTYRLRHPEKLKAKDARFNESKKRWRATNLDEARRQDRAAYRRKKQFYWRQILAAYGAFCACCGETIEEFLTLDHVGGWGKHHRKSVDNYFAMFKDVIAQGFPATYRILCINCNLTMRDHGICPHQQICDGTYVPPSAMSLDVSNHTPESDRKRRESNRLYWSNPENLRKHGDLIREKLRKARETHTTRSVSEGVASSQSGIGAT